MNNQKLLLYRLFPDMPQCEDDICVAGGVEIPDSMLRKDVVEFSNFPDDDLSRTILQLVGLHLWSWTDEQKKEVIEALQNVRTTK
jgi:hypothetical protein